MHLFESAVGPVYKKRLEDIQKSTSIQNTTVSLKLLHLVALSADKDAHKIALLLITKGLFICFEFRKFKSYFSNFMNFFEYFLELFDNSIQIFEINTPKISW